MASSFLHILTLPLFLFLSTATATATPTTTVQEACGHTLHAQLCIDSLLTFPESQTADLHKLTALAVLFAANNGAEITGVVHDVANKSVLTQCLNDCVEHIEDGVEQLDICTGALDNKSYDKVASLVNTALTDATFCNEGCEDVRSEPEAVEMKKKADHFYDLCSIALALIHSLVK